MGYRKGGDGYGRCRTASAPGALPEPDRRNRARLRRIAAKGARLDRHPSWIDKGKFSDQIKAAIGCQHQMWTYGWYADYPDGDHFMQLLCGSNINQSNVAVYASPKYDALYKELQLMRDSPERNQFFERMTRQFEANTPWRLGISPYRSMLSRPRGIRYKARPVLLGEWIYVDIDTKPR